MTDKEKIIQRMNELMNEATEESLRLLLIAAHGILGK